MGIYDCEYLTYENHEKAQSKSSEVWLKGKIHVSTEMPKFYIGNFGMKTTCEYWFVTDHDGVNVYDDVAAVSCADFSIN